MVEVAVIVTIGTVLILFALAATTAWIVPKVLQEETHGYDEREQHLTEHTGRSD